jgi:FkbM family methyltransferase
VWFVHRVIRAGYSVMHSSGLLSNSLGRSFYRKLYDSYKRSSDAPLIHVLIRDFRPGTIAIDVGANIGTYSKAFSESISTSGVVLAVEADPNNAEYLRRRFADSASIRVVEAAAADKSGMLRLRQDPYNPAGHALSDTGIAVASISIDELVDQIGMPVSIMKIDVEGAEPLVIRGAKATIERDLPTILLEYSPERMSAFSERPVAVLEYFESLGYEIAIPGRVGRQTLATIEEASLPRGYIDVLIRKKKVTA